MNAKSIRYATIREDELAELRRDAEAWRSRKRNDERSVRVNQLKSELMVKVAIASGSSVPEIRDKAELIAQKLKVDAEISELKVRIGRAKSIARTAGSFMKVSDFRRLEEQLLRLKSESQAIQARLGELKKKRNGDFLQTFADVARERLESAVFHEILAEASWRVDDPGTEET